MFFLSSDTSTKNFNFDFLPLIQSPAIAMANAYNLSSPIELLQLRHSPDRANNVFVIFGINSNGVYYTSFSPIEEAAKQNSSESKSIYHLHSHEYYEFMFVLDGTIYQNIEHCRHYYPAGGCCLVSPHVLHTEEYSTECRVLFFKISKDFIEQLLNFPRYFSFENGRIYKRIQEYFHSDQHFIDFIPSNNYQWIQHHIHNIFEKMFYELFSPSDSASLKLAYYSNQLMMELFNDMKFNNTPVISNNQQNQDLFFKIRDYMLSSSKKITRSDLETHFNYSGDNLYKIIKNFTGLSIHDYSSYICIQKAANLLINTNLNINDIAESVGFHNFTQFYKEFKKSYHMTPRSYRLKFGP